MFKPKMDQFLAPGATYLTIRKVGNGKWVAEKLFLKDDELVIEKISEIGGRSQAVVKFKVAATEVLRAKD